MQLAARGEDAELYLLPHEVRLAVRGSEAELGIDLGFRDDHVRPRDDRDQQERVRRGVSDVPPVDHYGQLDRGPEGLVAIDVQMRLVGRDLELLGGEIALRG